MAQGRYRSALLLSSPLLSHQSEANLKQPTGDDLSPVGCSDILSFPGLRRF